MLRPVDDVERLILDLPYRQRAVLAARLMDSLPGTSAQKDQLADAVRRSFAPSERPLKGVFVDSWVTD